MGRSSKTKVRDVIDEPEGGISPGAAALSVLALGLGGMIVWNAFFGHHEQPARRSLAAQIPPGASTRVQVTAPAKNTTSITIKYDPQVEDVQRELLATGHFQGLVDGVVGKQTNLAIRRYQQDNQLTVDGEVTRRLLDHIRYTRKVVAASETTGSLALQSKVQVQRQAKPLAKTLAKTIAKPVAKALVKAKTTPEATPTAIAAQPQGLPRVREAQKRLKKLGYDLTFVTGEPDEETRAAILKFQLDYGLVMDGVVSKELLAALKVADAAQSAAAQ